MTDTAHKELCEEISDEPWEELTDEEWQSHNKDEADVGSVQKK